MVKRLSEKDKKAIRHHSLRFLEETGFVEPPFIADRALSARQLTLFPGDLTEVLADHLPGEQSDRVDAMLQTQERLIAIRRSLTVPQQKWGCVHEVGHDYLPWHRDLLYFCSILRLPPGVRAQLEMEADAFAADSFFFGDRFGQEANECKFGLGAPKRLAEERYQTSYYATFRRYVEENPRPCCLLVCQPKWENGNRGLMAPSSLVLKYYVKSPSYRRHIPPGQDASRESEIYRAYYENTGGIRKHSLAFKSGGSTRKIPAESFCNSYTVFTLIGDAGGE